MPLMSKPTVLLTNDDGPPDPRESPYVLGLYRHLTEQLGWDVKVVLPSSQKSWIGKAYQIKEVTRGFYFYPKEDGKGEILDDPRPLKEGELAEWILFDSVGRMILRNLDYIDVLEQTPATCANIALHNLFPGLFDLVISGPNLGRNTSAAFALSSGTIGAAMSSALSGVRAVALSYGTVIHPTPTSFFTPAHRLGASIVQHLWHNWGKDKEGLRDGEVDLYNVNIPLVEGLLSEDGLKIFSTTMWRNSYARLFKAILKDTTQSMGPDPIENDTGNGSQLLFKFGPDMKNLLDPALSSLPVGCDGWALHQGAVSVTPLRACFAEVEDLDEEQRQWKMKL